MEKKNLMRKLYEQVRAYDDLLDIPDTDFDKNFGTSNQRNIAICKEIGADVYLSGNGAKTYNDNNLFKNSSIDLLYQDYLQPSYKQQSIKFVPGLSIIDMLFNCGYEETERLLKR